MNYSLKLSDRKILLLIIDLLLILITTLFSLWIHANGRPSLIFNFPYLVDHIGWLILLAVLWLFSAYIHGLYDPIKIAAPEETVLLLIRSGTIVLIVYLFIFFYTAPTIILPRGIVVYQIISGFLLISIWRFIYIFVFGQPRFTRKIVIIGAGWAGKTIAQAIHENAFNQYQIIGFIDDDPSITGTEIELDLENSSIQKKPIRQEGENQLQKLPVLGTAHDLFNVVKRNTIPEIVLAITYDISTELFRSLMDCKELGVDITLMSEMYEEITGKIPIEHIGDNWFVSLPMDSAETSVFYAIASRIFDLVGAFIGLALLLPFLPIVALAIYLDSPGPIFYRQTRVGKGGKEFVIHKLRTMFPEAEKGNPPHRAELGDSRITRLGRWLRKFRLDEMPQLYNIFKGEMSSVGPRPERPYHLAELDEVVPYHRLRNAVKPGMAGWAVVNYGYVDNVESAKVRLQYDLYYVKHQSLMLDFIILFRTFGQIFQLKGR